MAQKTYRSRCGRPQKSKISAKLYHAGHIFLILPVFNLLELPIWAVKLYVTKGECEMMMPKTIAAWCTVLFFLFYGLGYFLPSLSFLSMLAALLALGAAVFTFIGR